MEGRWRWVTKQRHPVGDRLVLPVRVSAMVVLTVLLSPTHPSGPISFPPTCSHHSSDLARPSCSSGIAYVLHLSP